MKVSLRKANVLQNNIQDVLKNIKIVTNIEINEFQNAKETIHLACENLYKTDSRREQLTRALYKIRTEIGIVNATSGISKYLSEAAFLDKRIVQLEDLAKSTEMVTLEIIKGKIDKIIFPRDI